MRLVVGTAITGVDLQVAATSRRWQVRVRFTSFRMPCRPCSMHSSITRGRWGLRLALSAINHFGGDQQSKRSNRKILQGQPTTLAHRECHGDQV